MQYYNIRACLVLANASDIYDSENYFFENKNFYMRDPFTKKFRQRFKIPNDFPWAKKDSAYYARKNYWINQISLMLFHNQLYKVVLPSLQKTEEIFLTVKTAVREDLFYNQKNILENTMYYKLCDNNATTGPYFATKFCDENEILQLLNEDKILIPTNRQLFEPFMVQNIA